MSKKSKVAISCLISIPLVWYYLNGWLNNYNYRTDISVWVIVLSCTGALFITLLTVSFQSIKVALTSPVKSLHTEWKQHGVLQQAIDFCKRFA